MQYIKGIEYDLKVNVRDYFQEWIDINAIQHFNKVINRSTTLKSDWISLSDVAYQMKFYGYRSATLMTHSLERKWIKCIIQKDGTLSNHLTKEFRTFKHQHPLILHLFDFIHRIYSGGIAARLHA